MRILVAGAGSVGSAWGGLLCQAGHDVTLLGRAPHLAAIRERGLAITGLWGEWLVSGLHLATEAEALADGSPFDLILVAVKS